MISKVLTRTAPLVSRAALGWTIWLGGAAAALAQVLAQLQDFNRQLNLQRLAVDDALNVRLSCPGG